MNLCTNAAHALDETGGVLEIFLNNSEVDRGDAVVPMKDLANAMRRTLDYRKKKKG